VSEEQTITTVKMLKYMSQKAPAVYCHGGNFTSVGPIFFKIAPFLAEPKFQSSHTLILETLGGLLPLLQANDPALMALFTDTLTVLRG